MVGEIAAAVAGATSLAGSLLLAAAGIFKLVRPDETTKALAVVGLPESTAVVRGLAVGELGVAAWVLVSASPWSLVALMVVYGGFAVFVVFALVADVPLRTCGCFGKLDTPPSTIHIAIDLSIAAMAFAAAAEPEAAVSAIWEAGVAAWLGVAVLAYLLFGSMTALPLVSRSVRLR